MLGDDHAAVFQEGTNIIPAVLIPLRLDDLEAFGQRHAEIAVTGDRIQLTERHFVFDDDVAHGRDSANHLVFCEGFHASPSFFPRSSMRAYRLGRQAEPWFESKDAERGDRKSTRLNSRP